MLIHIVTIHYAHNYGAVLQAFSLKSVLEKWGHEVHFINYVPALEKKKYAKKLKNDVGLRHSLKSLRPDKWVMGLFSARAGQREWSARYENFENFIQEKLLCGYLGGKELDARTAAHIKTDILICGSDQVWSEIIGGAGNPVYYLAFNDSAVKISYAASMGTVYKPGEESLMRIVPWLQAFRAVSVREEALRRMLENDLGIQNVSVTVDPCLLLKKKDFAPIISREAKEVKPYVLAYYIVEDGPMKEIFRKKTQMGKAPIIEIHWKRQLFCANQNQRNSLTVGEFLWYFLHADCIYTDSFHGVVFALIFHRPFYAVYQENVRIDNLLSAVGLERRHICAYDDCGFNQEIDWDVIEEKLELLRQKSLQFLEQAICSEGN